MTLFREEVRDHRAYRLHGEVVLTQPWPVQAVIAVLFGLIVVVGAWIGMGRYARVEVASGILVTDESSSKIFAPVAGVVTQLSVSEGSLVKRGDQLAIINLDRQDRSGKGFVSQGLETVDARLAIGENQMRLAGQHSRLDTRRLQVEVRSADEQVGNLEAQIELQEQNVKSNGNLFKQIESVVARGFVSKVEYERRRQEYIGSQQELRRLESQKISQKLKAEEGRAQLRSTEVQVEQDLAVIKSSLSLLGQQKAQLDGSGYYVITAPIDGRVTAVQTAVGRMAAALPLMAILPRQSKLRADVYAPSRAIGFVRPGQETRILYDAFPYQRFGSVEGRIRSVSRVVLDPRESDTPLHFDEPVYKVTVDLKKQYVEAFGARVPLQSGMVLQANIILERQSFVEWLLKPLNAVLKRTT